MNELTDAEVERIDLLHNETHEYLTRILAGYYTEWDADLIDRVAEAVWEQVYDKGWMTEMEFYPYRDEDEDERDCATCRHCHGVDERRDVCKCELRDPHADWRYKNNEPCPKWHR